MELGTSNAGEPAEHSNRKRMVNADASGARQPVYLTAQLTVNVGAANANKLGTLFYYNVDNQILEYMGQSDTDADGNVIFLCACVIMSS